MLGGLVKRYWGYCGNSFTESEFLRFWTIFYTDYGEPALFPRSVNFLSRWKFTTRVGRIQSNYIYISYILICWWKNLILRKYRPICQRNIRNKRNPWNGSMSVDWNQKKRVKWKAHASCRNFIEESTGCSTGNTRTPSRPLPSHSSFCIRFFLLSLSPFFARIRQRRGWWDGTSDRQWRRKKWRKKVVRGLWAGFKGRRPDQLGIECRTRYRISRRTRPAAVFERTCCLFERSS